MKTYTCFYARQSFDVPARSTFEAQCVAAKLLQLPESKRILIAVRRPMPN